MVTQPTHLLHGKTPEQALQAFCQAYPLEEAQAALWQCLQPRLLQLASQASGPGTDRQLAFLEHLELLLPLLYQLPSGSGDPPTSSGSPPPG